MKSKNSAPAQLLTNSNIKSGGEKLGSLNSEDSQSDSASLNDPEVSELNTRTNENNSTEGGQFKELTNPIELLEIIDKHIALNELMAASEYCKHLFTLELHPDLLEKAYYHKGKIAYLMHDYSTAEMDLRNGGQEASYILAEMYHKLGHKEHAYYYYEQANSFEAFWAAGELGRTHDFELAKKFFEAATAIAERDNRPELWDCYLKLGAIHHTTDRGIAESYYTKSRATGKAEPRLYNNLCVFNLENKNPDAALEILDESIDRFPDDSLAYFNRSCIYALKNDTERALEALRQALYNGYQNFRNLQKDKDLESIRENDEFKELVKAYDNYSQSIDEESFAEHPERYTRARVYSYSRLKDKKLPDYLYKGHNIESLKIDDHALKDFPIEILQLKKLKCWSFMGTSIKEVPEEILDVPYESTAIELKRITEFPAYLSRLSGLKKLYLSSVKFTEIPKEIGHFKALEDLMVKHSKISRIDREIGSLSNLNSLEIRDTQIDSLPVEIAKLNKLRELIVSNNTALKYFPEEIFLIPSLERVSFHKNGFPSTEATKLFEECIDKKLDRKSIAIFMALLQENKTYLAQNASAKDILQALNLSVGIVRNNALLWLADRPIECKLTGESEVLLLGKFDQSTTEIKKQIADLGIKLSKKYTDSTTHILVGQKPGDKLIPLLENSVQWITEQQLVTEEESNEPLESSTELSDVRGAQIKMLLRSIEADNLMMALELIDENNAVKTFEPELFLAYQYVEDKNIKKQLLSLAKVKGDKAFQTLMLKKFGFKTASEKKVNEYVTTIAPEMSYDSIEFAYSIFKLSSGRSGIEYLFEKGSPEMCHEACNALIEGNKIHFSYDYELTDIPQALENFQNINSFRLNSKKLKDFPMVLSTLSNLNELDLAVCSIKSIPVEIGKLQHLKTLDISQCRFTKFPDSVGQLKNLEVLNMSYNKSLTKISAEISGLSNLQELNLSDTKITSLPPEMAQLSKLKKLGLADNNRAGFTDFPDVLTKLPALEELSLRIDQVEAFGSKLTEIKGLKTLSICYGYKEADRYEAIKGQFLTIEVKPTSVWH